MAPLAIMLAIALPASFAVAVMALLWLSPSWNSFMLTVLLLSTACAIFVTARHVQLVTARIRRAPQLSSRKLEAFSRGHRSGQGDYNLFVLGSGGHTKEMLMMMDDGFCDFANFHRRYLISSGDRMSLNHLSDYEQSLQRLCQRSDTEAGTFDSLIVTRARRVHQPLWTTPLTSLISILDIFPVLLLPPPASAGAGVPRYPTKIYSNGPANGFFVALAVHLLKMFYVVPQESMKFIYVESWARISTLSLTGKLLLSTNMADVILVQHAAVAARYGLDYAGEMVFNARRDDLED